MGRLPDLRHIAALAVAAPLLLTSPVAGGGLPRPDPEPADSVAAPVAAPAPTDDAVSPPPPPSPQPDARTPLELPDVEVVVPVDEFGEFAIRFFRQETPHHVAAFLTLAGSGAYDSLGFHRVIPGFLIQTGDPTSRDEDRNNDGWSAPPWRIPAEPSDRTHVRGTVSMAWQGDDPASAGSQWFVTLDDAPRLDGHATPIGEVVRGMDVVDQVAQVSTLRNRHPLQPVRIGKLRLVSSSGSSPGHPPASSSSRTP